LKIYFGHSSGIEFRKEFYRPLEESDLSGEHELVFPHENSGEPFDSKKFLREEADLFIAEVSEASTGLGIELGWADLFEVPVLCVHREDAEVSSSLQAVDVDLRSYRRPDNIPVLLQRFLD
jgi:hypothetical protein